MMGKHPLATHLPLSFVHVSNPAELKLKSKRTVVRSHVALLQHHSHRVRSGLPKSKRAQKRAEKKIRVSTLDEFTPVNTTSCSSQGNVNDIEVGHKNERPQTRILPPFRNTHPFELDPFFHGIIMRAFQFCPALWKDEYNAILSFYLEKVCVNVREADTEGKAFIKRFRTHWFPFMLSSREGFYAVLALSYTTYLLTLGQITQPPLMLRLRLHAIEAINSSLSHPKSLSRVDGTTIAAVLCMCGVESMYGDTAAYKVHMSGLQKMVQMRGGLETLPLEGMVARMITLVDWSHSKKHRSKPYFGLGIEEGEKPPFQDEDLEQSPVVTEMITTLGYWELGEES